MYHCHTTLPYEQYSIIGIHRSPQTGRTARGVLLQCPCKVERVKSKMDEVVPGKKLFDFDHTLTSDTHLTGSHILTSSQQYNTTEKVKWLRLHPNISSN